MNARTDLLWILAILIVGAVAVASRTYRAPAAPTADFDIASINAGTSLARDVLGTYVRSCPYAGP